MAVPLADIASITGSSRADEVMIRLTAPESASTRRATEVRVEPEVKDVSPRWHTTDRLDDCEGLTVSFRRDGGCHSPKSKRPVPLVFLDIRSGLSAQTPVLSRPCRRVWSRVGCSTTSTSPKLCRSHCSRSPSPVTSAFPGRALPYLSMIGRLL